MIHDPQMTNQGSTNMANLHGTTILGGKSIGFDPKKARAQRKTHGLEN